MKETENFRKLVNLMESYEDDDEDDDEYQDDWSEVSDIRDPYNRLLNTLATAFFDKYEDDPKFDHDYEDMVNAFDNGLEAVKADAILGFDPDNATLDQLDAMTPQQLLQMVDNMWTIEHGDIAAYSRPATHDAPSRMQ